MPQIDCSMWYDKWEPFRGKYPEPTFTEFNLINDYIVNCSFEYDDFVEDPDWISRTKNCQLLIELLRQVRESKGYDVDIDLDVDFWRPFFVRHNLDFWIPIFVRRNLDEGKFYKEAMATTEFAIRKINAHMKMSGKSYELVSVDKFVSAKFHSAMEMYAIPNHNTLLLTFSANEINKANVVTFQAMVLHPEEVDDGFKLREWKFKPIPIN